MSFCFRIVCFQLSLQHSLEDTAISTAVYPSLQQQAHPVQEGQTISKPGVTDVALAVDPVPHAQWQQRWNPNSLYRQGGAWFESPPLCGFPPDMLSYALSLQDDAVLSTNQENQLINNFDSAAPSVPHSSGACFDSATLSGSSSVVPSDSAAPLFYPTGGSTGISGFTGTGWGIGAQLSLPSFDPSVGLLD